MSKSLYHRLMLGGIDVREKRRVLRRNKKRKTKIQERGFGIWI